MTTASWDCCKVSCGWPGKASVTSPAQTCIQDGITAIDSNTASACNGGSAYVCNNQQPWNVTATLSYGYAGAFIMVSQFIFFSIKYMFFSHIRVKENRTGVVPVIHYYLQQVL
jgi:hypothetical protein